MLPDKRELKQTPGADHYSLACCGCSCIVEENGYVLECPKCGANSLLRAKYDRSALAISHGSPGLFRYRDWLPIWRAIYGSGRTATFQSERLSAVTGLKNLWIAFNGYWPEKGAYLPTGSFKDLEAHCVLGRIPLDESKVLTVASAGNTAAAFANACSVNNVPCLIVIPEFALSKMRFSAALAPCVKVVALTGSADYLDAIRAAQHLTTIGRFFSEGGAKNVARRDGLGTVILSFVEETGRLPDYYFQAIGSGTGAIAVHEAALRITKGSGKLPRLYLSQNIPFVPIYSSWKTRSREWINLDALEAKHALASIHASVLSNRKPPYSVQGGLYDALTESGGDVLIVTNEEAAAAARLFEECEKIDLEPAAGVAFASLIASCKHCLLEPSATVLLNITGGGRRRREVDFQTYQHQPDLLMEVNEIGTGFDLEQVGRLF